MRAGPFTCIIAALLLLGLSSLAAGTYEHARAVGKRCATCHDSLHPNATNLNATGRFFLVNRRLPLEGESTEGTRPSSEETGADLYKRACATCHGTDAKGTALGPSLAGTLKHGDSAQQLRSVVRSGVPQTAMVAFAGTLSDEQIERIVEHVLDLRKLPSRP